MASNGRDESSTNPGESAYAEAASHNPAPQSEAGASASPAKKRKHRGGKKRRNRRQSFANALDTGDITDDARPSLVDLQGTSSRGNSSFYRLRQKRSNDSLESEAALLDHRDQPVSLQTRRASVQASQLLSPPQRRYTQPQNPPSVPAHQQYASNSDHDDDEANDRTPLMSSSVRDVRSAGYGGASNLMGNRRRRESRSSSASNNGLGAQFATQHHSHTNLTDYDVNNPPSVPASPVLGPELNSYGDVMLPTDIQRGSSRPGSSGSRGRTRDILINIDEEPPSKQIYESAPTSPPAPGDMRRRMTLSATEDVCFPLEGMSEIGHEDEIQRSEAEDTRQRRRRRRWPDLRVLEAWSHEEKEQRTMEGMRARKVSEPLMVDGRLRPQKRTWHKDTEDAPYRFTYFNEEFDNTIHSQSISELLQPGQTFRQLFIPDPPILEDSSDDETDDEEGMTTTTREATMERPSMNGLSRAESRTPTTLHAKQPSSGEHTRSSTPGRTTPMPPQEQEKKAPRYGPRPAFWLDVLSPTDAEMKVISKAFGIHPLTAEDILMQEPREKVELFKHYYFINYRTFEQDENSEDYLEPVNLYVVVFKEGVISFHFSMTPHPANVRRRIRQLKDYLILSPDWISYGLIDDVTDAYAPLIERIEQEVDDIDEAILRSYSQVEEKTSKSKKDPFNILNEKESDDEEGSGGRDMLRRVGEARKRVMTLYRLLSTKADVIKGFAKRCTEQWDVAPRGEIGLYLGDIQDHIVTMTANLGHYENLLSRSHSNYLAHINIRMNERQEQTSDILGKLTVLGTIVLPMNVVTGIWGMNCLVPGQDIENLNWFWGITGSLIAFGLSCYFIAKRIYNIV
ncbi:cora-domain-containing protein [Bimuria novae-zelandiae CBS 107.79]|uniref:Cora-domain-containing protein n=1 Tax=Bimuria novae-zelandiae CBS 107.79 TaxID=1447943 RepID=A0A6A5W2F3_9PLEO|nr:cora-domain-containing protein [Bimuria novae-zelandiae CBS 107.79]